MQPSFAIAFVERSSRRIDEFTRRPAASAATPSSLYGGGGVGGEETKSCKITERERGQTVLQLIYEPNAIRGERKAGKRIAFSQRSAQCVTAKIPNAVVREIKSIDRGVVS